MAQWNLFSNSNPGQAGAHHPGVCLSLGGAGRAVPPPPHRRAHSLLRPLCVRAQGSGLLTELGRGHVAVKDAPAQRALDASRVQAPRRGQEWELRRVHWDPGKGPPASALPMHLCFRNKGQHGSDTHNCVGTVPAWVARTQTCRSRLESYFSKPESGSNCPVRSPH